MCLDLRGGYDFGGGFFTGSLGSVAIFSQTCSLQISVSRASHFVELSVHFGAKPCRTSITTTVLGRRLRHLGLGAGAQSLWSWHDVRPRGAESQRAGFSVAPPHSMAPGSAKKVLRPSILSLVWLRSNAWSIDDLGTSNAVHACLSWRQVLLWGSWQREVCCLVVVHVGTNVW